MSMDLVDLIPKPFTVSTIQKFIAIVIIQKRGNNKDLINLRVTDKT